MEEYGHRVQKSVQVYPLSNYTIGVKAPLVEKHASIAERVEALKQSYKEQGARRSVEAIVLVQEHNHPHILLLQLGPSYWRLPGGRLRPGEGEVEGLQRKLVNKLSPVGGVAADWDISECAGVWWRPNFDNLFYPYLPPHITRPKEQKKMFVVQLPDQATFAIPQNQKLLAVPLFDLYDKPQKYGTSIASIPQLLSRMSLTLM